MGSQGIGGVYIGPTGSLWGLSVYGGLYRAVRVFVGSLGIGGFI